MEHLPGLFTIVEPSNEHSPLVVEVPRSGRQYPNDFQVACDFSTLHAYVSMYVEEIYGETPQSGASLLWANFPNSWIDLNRHLEDIDPALLAEPWPGPIAPGDKSLRLGTGLIHKWGKDDLPLYDRKLAVDEVRHRIEHYYRPYHERLAQLIQANVESFGASWHISCHCMASVGPRWSHDKGLLRKDFCVSDLNGKTADPEFLDIAVKAIESEGFTVSVNTPFVGGECVRQHSDVPSRRNSLQFEMIKGLYMDEDTWRKTERFDDVRKGVGKVIARISAYCRDAAKRQTTLSQ